jgi:hypothetical protein
LYQQAIDWGDPEVGPQAGVNLGLLLAFLLVFVVRLRGEAERQGQGGALSSFLHSVESLAEWVAVLVSPSYTMRGFRDRWRGGSASGRH